MIKIQELMKKINDLGLPVAYHQFIATEENSPPTLPFVIYLEEDSDNIAADNGVYKKVVPYNIELYSAYRMWDIEARIEEALEDNKVFYQTSNLYIPSEKMFQRIYSITLI